MNLLTVIGIILGVLAAIVLLCLGVLWLEKRFPSEAYDERQKQAQGRASRLGMITGMLYFMVIMVVMINQVDNSKTVEPYLLVFFGILLMLTVDHTYCFFSHAALPLSQTSMLAVVCYAISGVVQLLYIVHFTERMPLTWLGHGTTGWIHLLAGIDFLYLSLMHLLQYLRSKRAGDE